MTMTPKFPRLAPFEFQPAGAQVDAVIAGRDLAREVIRARVGRREFRPSVARNAVGVVASG